jgi:hypothetical protein
MEDFQRENLLVDRGLGQDLRVILKEIREKFEFDDVNWVQFAQRLARSC